MSNKYDECKATDFERAYFNDEPEFKRDMRERVSICDCKESYVARTGSRATWIKKTEVFVPTIVEAVEGFCPHCNYIARRVVLADFLAEQSSGHNRGRKAGRDAS